MPIYAINTRIVQHILRSLSHYDEKLKYKSGTGVAESFQWYRYCGMLSTLTWSDSFDLFDTILKVVARQRGAVISNGYSYLK